MNFVENKIMRSIISWLIMSLTMYVARLLLGIEIVNIYKYLYYFNAQFYFNAQQ